jgi:hypothetical protein
MADVLAEVMKHFVRSAPRQRFIKDLPDGALVLRGLATGREGGKRKNKKKYSVHAETKGVT